MMINPEPLVRLVDELLRRGLTLPADVLRGRTLLADVGRAPAVASLLSLDADQLREEVERRTLRESLSPQREEATVAVARELATETGRVLLDGLDGLLDQLRPAFDAAGQAVREAVALGIAPRMSADAVLLLPAGQAAVTAWLALPGHLAVLEDLSKLRLRLCEDLGAEPGSDPRAYAACFAAEGSWTLPGEKNRDTWLRLSELQPVRLLAVAETRQAAVKMRPQVSPLNLVEDEDGALRLAG